MSDETDARAVMLKTLAFIIVAVLIMAAIFVILTYAIGYSSGGPPSDTPPPAPKTRAQIATEAYAIEAAARAAAGRKTVALGAAVQLAKKTDCYALRSDAFHPASLACDNVDNAGAWQDSAGGAGGFPRWIVTNLTATHLLEKVAINFPAFPGVAGGTIQYWNGASWVSDGTFSIANCNSGSGENVTATLTTRATTSAYRLYFSVGGCSNYVTLGESWPYGDPPIIDPKNCVANTVKTAATYTTDTTWSGVHYRITGTQNITVTGAAHVTFTIVDSCIDGGGMTGAFFVDDNTTQNVYVWDGSSGVSLIVRNSTIKNVTRFVTVVNRGGNFRVGATVVTIDNSTLNDFGTFMGPHGGVLRTGYLPIHDSDVSAYNRADNGDCAFSNTDAGDVQSESFTKLRLYRVHFTRTAQTSGCAIGDALIDAKYNVFDGGFLQITFGADFQHGVSPNFGTPTEVLNWSYNYANDSRHTVFGFYGTGTGAFSGHLGTNAYATVYHNYVNNSRYIPYQSSGNQTGGRYINNYARGPIPWPGGTPTFELALFFGEENHDFVIERNYLWDMDSERIAGIVLDFASYNMTVRNNVLYDIGGNHIRIGGSVLKYQNPVACPGPGGCSDYSWKGSSNVIEGNYLSGGTHDRAISVDSGYTTFRNNAVVSGPSVGMFDLIHGWACNELTATPCSYLWVDWIDGFPDIPTIRFDAAIPSNVSHNYWVRSMRTGPLILVGGSPLTVSINATSSDPWGTLAARCVENGAATGGHTTSDAEVLAWSGHTCGAVVDARVISFASAGTKIANEPERFYNKTVSGRAYNPIGVISYSGRVSVIDNPYTGNVAWGVPQNWPIAQGHTYTITELTFPTTDPMGTATSAMWVLAWLAFLVAMVIGALWLRRKLARRGGE